MRDLYLSEESFWSITLSSIEVFKRECLGYLVGYQMEGRWVVQRAVPHQAAQRSFAWVMPKASPRRRIESALASLAMGEEVIGWFHSHPSWGDQPARADLSEADKEYTERLKVEVALVVAIHEKKREVHWAQNKKDGSISGTLGQHHLRLKTYARNAGGQMKPVLTHCAYAHGFEPG